MKELVNMLTFLKETCNKEEYEVRVMSYINTFLSEKAKDMLNKSYPYLVYSSPMTIARIIITLQEQSKGNLAA